MGYCHVANHRTKAIETWQQGDITYLLNDEPGTHARDFVAAHDPCAPPMGWRLIDAAHALQHAIAKGARNTSARRPSTRPPSPASAEA